MKFIRINHPLTDPDKELSITCLCNNKKTINTGIKAMIDPVATSLVLAAKAPSNLYKPNVRGVLLSSFKTSNGQRKLFQAEMRSEEHTSELQSRGHIVCRLLLEK